MSIKFKKLGLILSVILVLLGCRATPKLTNAHAGKFEVEDINIDSIRFLDVNVALIPVPNPKKPKPQKAKTFFDLRDSVPHTFLRELSKKTPKPEDFIKYIKAELSEKPKTKPTRQKTDYAKRKMRFVLGNTKRYGKYASKMNELAHPNTRVAYLNTTLDFSGSKFTILSIDKLMNEFEEIPVADISRSQTASFNSKVTGQFGLTNTNTATSLTNEGLEEGSQMSDTINAYDEDGNLIGTIATGSSNKATNSEGSTNEGKSSKNFGLSGEASYSNTESISEALKLKLKRLKTGVSFTKNKVTISQHGSNLLDVSDNVVFTATVIPNNLKVQVVTSFNNFLDKKKNINPADSLGFSQRTIKYVACNELNAAIDSVTISFDGMIRTVRNLTRGDNNLEYDDKVFYRPFSKQKDSQGLSFASWPDCKEAYFIHYIDKISGKKYILSGGHENIKPLFFLSEEKDGFFDWITNQLSSPKKENLETKLFKLSLVYSKKIEANGKNDESSNQEKEIIKIIDQDLSKEDLKRIEKLKLRFKMREGVKPSEK